MNLSEYTWPRPPGFTPFEHQKTTAEFLTTNRKAFCFNEQGTGKTASVIWAVDYLMTIGLVKRVLVICPLSIMKSALLFVVSKEFVRAMHYTEMVEKYIEPLARDVARIEAALENGVWNPIQGPLCKFCSVRECEYNRN